MAVECPYCRHANKVKPGKPGRFTATCPKCTRKFLLTVPHEPGIPPKVTAIHTERSQLETVPAPSSECGPAVSETDAWSPAPAPEGPDPYGTVATSGDVSPAQGDPEATAAHVRSRREPSLARTRDDPDATREAMPATARERRGDASSDAPTRPSSIGGYQVLGELGRGGMGAVYLARQLSLNRNVALKVMRPEWASDAAFVARFTREAYAAAQLTHHNVVQVYDFGEDKGTTYFSMEFVDGENLGRLVRQKKRLDVEEAAGYVLQAARGLKFAHDQSLIHRDVKPENLLLNRQGVVKVADLGLVKTPAAAEAEEAGAAVAAVPATDKPGITLANAAMGTPAFMAPEQALDAAHVDGRADIYSLGCTLYDLVTGKPPFEGKTVLEVMSKHQTEPVTPPEHVVKRMPRALSEIIMKMVAKKPEERFANLAEVIRALENFLGVQSAGPFTPREEHANLLEESVAAFHAAPSARLRAALLPVGLGVCCVLVAFFALIGKPSMAGVFLALALLTSLAYFALHGFRERSPAFQKACELALSSRVSEWLMAAAALALVLVGLSFAGQLWIWLAAAVVAVMIAMGIELTLDRNAKAERSAPLTGVEEMLRSMRLQGLNEDALRQFVCKYSGDHWEEFYEALFGYEAKLEARSRWGRGDRGRARPKFAPWRDPLVAWLDVKTRSRREASEKAKLEKIEERGLCARGENLVTARRKAKRTAAAMVATAAEIRSAGPLGTRERPVSIARAMREAAANPEKVLVVREKGLHDDRSGTLVNLVIGPKPRFLAGLLLLAGSMSWMYKNELLTAEHARRFAEAGRQAAAAIDVKKIGAHLKDGNITEAGKAVAEGSNALTTETKATIEQARTARSTKTIEIPMVPSALAALVSSWGAAAAGLVLIVSALFGATRVALAAVASAAVMLFGPKLGLPTFNGRLDPSLAPVVIGSAIFVAGLFFNRGWR